MPASSDMSKHIGQRLSIKGELCTVRYVGTVRGKPGKFLGVEWDLAGRGKHDGSLEGNRYFTCRSRSDKCASFLKYDITANLPQTVHTAIERKYASGEIDFARTISFDSKVVEEKGYDKISTRQSKLMDLKVVVLDNQCLAGHPDDPETQLAAICPGTTDLQLGYNLFESLAEIGNIIHRSQHLRSLSLEGNRLHISEDGRSFATLSTLSLEGMLLLPAELRTIMLAFPKVRDLNVSSNLLNHDLHVRLPSTIEQLNLGSNIIEHLSVLRPFVESCQRLHRLVLKRNSIATIWNDNEHQSGNIVSSSLREIDLTENKIANFAFVDALPAAFPSLSHLRISNNPLYANSSRANGVPLTTIEVSLLIIARLPSLQSLNYSTIKPKDRLEAETFYLAVIAQELSLAPSAARQDIILRHPRYKDLCAAYGTPAIENNVTSDMDGPHPNSIAARVVDCHVYFSAKAHEFLRSPSLPDKNGKDLIQIPLSFSMYAMTAHIARRYGMLPSAIAIVWETGENDPVASSMVASNEVVEWDSDEDEIESASAWVEREVALGVGTRVVGSMIDGKKAVIRVEIKQGITTDIVKLSRFCERRTRVDP
ncbi:CAP-Gly domain-containing protein 2 [Elsinoe fawcettii]|nr:CAP-Gly domain-containing protein 2 [Elsinoe fawcettii]